MYSYTLQNLYKDGPYIEHTLNTNVSRPHDRIWIVSSVLRDSYLGNSSRDKTLSLLYKYYLMVLLQLHSLFILDTYITHDITDLYCLSLYMHTHSHPLENKVTIDDGSTLEDQPSPLSREVRCVRFTS